MAAPTNAASEDSPCQPGANGMDPALAAVESQASTAAKEDVMQVVRIGLDLARSSRRRQPRESRCAKEVTSRCGGRLFRQFTGLPSRHGGFQRGTLLGSRAHGAWPSGPTNQPSVRDTIRQVEQKRPERCGSHLRSGRSSVHALRATEINRSAGGTGRPPHSPAPGRRSSQARQSDSRSSVRAWDCHCP